MQVYIFINSNYSINSSENKNIVLQNSISTNQSSKYVRNAYITITRNSNYSHQNCHKKCKTFIKTILNELLQNVNIIDVYQRKVGIYFYNRLN